MRRPIIALTALFALVALTAGSSAGALRVIPSAALDIHNMEHVANEPNLSGNAIDFFERELEDGSTRWYLVAATQGNGFDIVDITDPTSPETVGRYLLGPDDRPLEGSTGINAHAWISVNPRRNVVALTTESFPSSPIPALTTRHVTFGIQFVDISDVTDPVPLGKIDDVSGPHTVMMMGDNHAYTTLNTYIVDYTDPMNPTAQRAGNIEGHEFWEDPNIPGLGYIGRASQAATWGFLDLSDHANPSLVSTVPVGGAINAHEVFPWPDSSVVGVAEFRAGPFEVACPGGAIHFYDVAGEHREGASRETPIKMGQWFAPFEGSGVHITNVPNRPINYASCTPHSWRMQPERVLALAGLYAGGTWVFDPSGPPQAGGDYEEYDGPNGRTTWGTTLGNVRDGLDYVNASQWLPFDTESPEAIENGWDRLVFTNGWVRGVDIYEYTGPMPKKLSRLTVDGTAAGGAVSGTLDRYAVLTSTGWENLPLAERTLEVTVGGETVEVVTDEDGGFSAALDLAPGAHTVVVTWAGDDRFEEATVTQPVTAP